MAVKSEVPQYISREEIREFLNPIETLANRLWKDGYRHWEDAFSQPNWSHIVYSYQIGKGKLHLLRRVEGDIGIVRVEEEVFRKDLFPIVAILPQLEKHRRRFLIVEGLPFIFVHPDINSLMADRLLKKQVVSKSTLEANDIKISDLEKDINYLNRNFQLGLVVSEGEGSGNTIGLDIPQTTKIVDWPMVKFQ